MSQLSEQETELARWATDWQASAPPVSLLRDDAPWARLRRQVEWRGRLLKWVLAGEVLLVGLGIAVVLRLALHFGRPVDFTFAAALSAFFVGLLGYALWNRRGLWSAASASSAAFLELALKRNERRQRSLRWFGWIVAAELALLVPWLLSDLQHRGADAAAYGQVIAVAGAVVGVVALGVTLARRYTRLEHARLLVLREELLGSESESVHSEQSSPKVISP